MSATNTSSLPVLIAGGGIGGLATAIALAQCDIPSIIFEKRGDAREVGAGIQIGPHGVKCLRALGVADSLAKHIGVPEAIVIRNGNNGEAITHLPLGTWIEQRYGAPYWVLHRADLHAALLAIARQHSHHIAIRHGTALSAFTSDNDHIRAQLKSQHGEYGIVGCALIGADGLWSTVRALLAAGGAVPISAAPRLSATSAARAVFSSPTTGPCAEPVVTLWLSSQSHIVHYPVRNGREVSVVAFAHDPPVRKEYQPENGAALAGRLGVTAPELTRTLTAVDTWDKWPVVGWNRPNYAATGRVVLLGDAAHLFRPNLAQGAVMALEDALSVAKQIASGGRDLPSALQNYANSRFDRVNRVARASYANGVSYHLPWPWSQARNAVLRNAGGKRVMSAYDWLYAATVP